MNPLWSWMLASLGVLALFLISRRHSRTAGWSMALAIQALWITYALVTEQYGFIFSALAYGAMYGKNLIAWRSESAAVLTGGEDSGGER